MATLASPRDRPPRAYGVRGKWTALALALFVNLLFVGVLVFSVSWQNRKPEAVTAELYAPPPPQPRVEVKPEPKPPPPAPEPKPAPKPPEPVVEKPDTRAADIALKAKREEERRLQEQAERVQREREQRQQEELRQKEEARKAEEKHQAELRERQARQIETLKAQAAREAQMRTQAERELAMRAQAERESRMRAQAEQETRARAEQAAASSARNNAQARWIDQIRSRIRGYINLPPDIPGNPEAIFDVVQLPTGEIIDVKLRKSSGVHAYDDAVQRAILKSSPLPRPDRADVFQRVLELRVRPRD